MASWKCFVCNWENAGRWEKCVKCGVIRVSNATESDGRLFGQLRAEIQKLKAEADRYNASAAKKWEYLQISSDQIQIPSGLTSLGSQGWELVSVASYSEGGGMVLNGVGGSSYAIKFMYVFKRPTTDDLLDKFWDVLNRTPSHLRNALRVMENI